MFAELTQENVITAIKTLIREGSINTTQYAVWWKDKFISPALVITKHYELEGKTINRKSINTDQAQKRLLELGFPIVETNIQDNFFSEKELKSFQILLARKDYDSTNAVDINIGSFLRETVWSKTQLWAEKLEQLGWKLVSKRKGWNTRHQKKGFQTYKQYAWCSLKPEDGENNLLLFTVGVGSTGSLEYKMDIQWNDKSFTQSQKDLFFNLREEHKASFQVIEKSDVSKHSWRSLIDKSDKFFTSHLSTYTEIYYALWPERRLMRLVYNDNNWQSPIERYWNPKWQGRTDKAHHDQYGFGFEEWLFNPRYLINGFQYGYVRGIDTMPENSSFINELYLYTLDHKTNNKFLVAKLKNVNILRNEEDIGEAVLDVFESGRDEMLLELEKVKADTKLLRNMPLKPNLSFDLNDVLNYEDSVLLPDDFLKIHRFIPNKVEGNLANIVGEIDESFKNPKLNFNEGNGTGSNSYSQNVSGGKRNVNRTHSDITNDLHRFLLASSEYKGYSISTERTKIGNNLVDCAAKKGGKLHLFEAKTTNSFLMNVRLALGQIIEYALLDKSVVIEKLLIVGPAEPNQRDLEYLDSLKKILELPLTYWSYSFEEKILSKKFKKH
tara:strand:- start:25804 stop:27636 length:1833 start_codon:yes stop_codon:yes gene_type:complete